MMMDMMIISIFRQAYIYMQCIYTMYIYVCIYIYTYTHIYIYIRMYHTTGEENDRTLLRHGWILGCIYFDTFGSFDSLCFDLFESRVSDF